MKELVNKCEIEYYSIIQGSGIIIDPRRFLVIINDEEYELYPKEFDVLYYLAQHPGWVLSAEQIYQAVWHDNLYGCEHVIYNTVSQIRKKLNMPDIIKTERRNHTVVRHSPNI